MNQAGNIFITVIIGLIGGGFAGWAIAFLTGQGNAGQSAGTGLGSLAGLLLAVVYLVIRATKRKQV